MSVAHREKRKVSSGASVDVGLPEARGPRAYRHGALEERRVGEIVEVPPHELAPKRFSVLRRCHGDHATSNEVADGR